MIKHSERGSNLLVPGHKTLTTQNPNTSRNHNMKFYFFARCLKMYQELVSAWDLIEIPFSHLSEIDLIKNNKKMCVVVFDPKG